MFSLPPPRHISTLPETGVRFGSLIVALSGQIGAAEQSPERRFLTRNGVRQESWQRIGGESPPRGKDQPSAPTPSDARRPARAAVKRSQGRPRAKY
jgi:hypothetical protein